MALICLLLDSTNQYPGRSYTCSVRDTIDQRQTTFPSIRFMQKYSRSYEDDFQLKILWSVGIGKWLEALCIFPWHRMLPKTDHFEDIQSSKYVFSYPFQPFSECNIWWTIYFCWVVALWKTQKMQAQTLSIQTHYMFGHETTVLLVIIVQQTRTLF